MLKPFSQACINNRDFILEHLRVLLNDNDLVLEIGSGTGQHAVYFSQKLPHVIWQASDLAENHEGILAWINDGATENCMPPLVVNVMDDVWLPKKSPQKVNVIFTANTLHIMSWECVTHFFKKAHSALQPKGYVVTYGPFNYNGDYTSESNERFDQFLKASNMEKGIRDIEKLNKLALDHYLQPIADHPMPANNRLLVWQYQPNE
ncbi:DUF938 domain-containing protein [Eionea flava]